MMWNNFGCGCSIQKEAILGIYNEIATTQQINPYSTKL